VQASLKVALGRSLVLWFALVGVPHPGVCFADGTPDSTHAIHWFPQTPIFPRLVADGTAEQFSLSKDLRSKRIVGSIGGLQRLLETRIVDLPVQVGVGATVYGNFIREPNVLNALTVDFFVDIPVDIRCSDLLSIRTGWGHYSAHLADDGIEVLGKHSINYAKDYIPLFAAYALPSIGGFVYGGARVDYFTIPERNGHFLLECGAEVGNISLGGGLVFYGAVDIKSHQEVSWATTQSYQAGVRLVASGSHAVRLAYTFRTGIDERGQFYSQYLTSSLLGVFLDF
jgi:hypothetical protein